MGNFIRKHRLLNIIPRIYQATKNLNSKYIQVLKWGFKSKEDTNFTYSLTPYNIETMASTIALITKISYQETLKFIMEPIYDVELRTFVIERIKKSNYISYMDNRCEFGRRIGWYAFTRIMKPKVIIETGVEKGLGSILLCSALLKNREEGFPGHHYGTDIDSTAGFLLSGKYAEVGEVLYGDSITSLKNFSGKIDLFINDSDHSAEYEYQEYLTVNSKLSKGAIILGDNSHSSDKLLKYSVENNRQFIFIQERPKNHWYPGAGIGISFERS